MTDQNKNENEGKKKSKLQEYLKRFGIGAFLFFTLKGIVWLFVFFFAAKSCTAL